jgi:hypothetical protein
MMKRIDAFTHLLDFMLDPDDHERDSETCLFYVVDEGTTSYTIGDDKAERKR